MPPAEAVHGSHLVFLPSPLVPPVNGGLVTMPVDGQPHIAGDAGVLPVHCLHPWQRVLLLWREIRCIAGKMPFHTLDDLAGEHGEPPLGIPAVGAGDIEVMSRYLQNAGDLGIEALYLLCSGIVPGPHCPFYGRDRSRHRLCQRQQLLPQLHPVLPVHAGGISEKKRVTALPLSLYAGALLWF